MGRTNSGENGWKKLNANAQAGPPGDASNEIRV
jgi:hypothetical protein